MGRGRAGAEQGPWRAFGEELGPLFQIVDDILDGDGAVLVHGAERARGLADEAAERALARLREIPADTSVLEEIVAGPRRANRLGQLARRAGRAGAPSRQVPSGSRWYSRMIPTRRKPTFS